MSVGQMPKRGERIGINLAAIFPNTADQHLSHRAKGSILPARVLFAGFALPPLQYPLQRIIDDPPAFI
jgi:hypothetical protein